MKHHFTLIAVLSVLTAGQAGVQTTIRSGEELRKAVETGACGCPFALDARVLVCPRRARAPFFVEDGSGTVKVFDTRAQPSLRLSVGDRVLLEGQTARAGDPRFVNANCDRISVVGHEEPVLPPLMSGERFQQTAKNYQHVRLRGTVRDAVRDDVDENFAFLILDDDDTVTYVACYGFGDRLADLRQLTGSTVEVTGITSEKNLTGRRFAGRLLFLSEMSAVRLVEKTVRDPFSVAELDDSAGLCVQQLAHAASIKVSGQVLATWHGNRMLLRRLSNDTSYVELIDAHPPRTGDFVDIVGNPETDLFHINLSRAIWRRRTAPLPTEIRPVRELSIGTMFSGADGRFQIKSQLQGEVVRTTGRVTGVLHDERGPSRLILEDGGRTLLVDASSAPQVFERALKDCLVRATGVCVMETENWRPAVPFPRVSDMFLVLRKPEDLEVVAAAPWWTPARFTWAIGLLLAVLGVILVWNMTLRTLVRRKSRALLKEQAGKLAEALRTDERTRLAAELHDYHSQNLTAISYQITAARKACANNPEQVASRLETASMMIKSCRTDLRLCLWDLRNDALNEPDFAEAIRQTVLPVAGEARIAIRFAGRRAAMSETTAHAVLSILRELVANAVNHGQAESIRIAGECRPDGLGFSVRDNGIGFDPVTCPGQEGGHFGIENIRERLRRINGSVVFHSRPNDGTHVRIEIPSMRST